MLKEKYKDEHGKFYGMATMGERGQIVMPVSARKKLLAKKGEKFLVVGLDNNVVAFVKLGSAKKLLENLEKKSKSLKLILKKMM